MTEVSEYPSPSILDSRRLTGANLFHASAGAVLEVEAAAVTDKRIAAWQQHVARLANELGWAPCSTSARVSADTAQLFITAPHDGLMTATSLNELAWANAENDHRTQPSLERALHAAWLIEHERLGAVPGLVRAAVAAGVNYCLDDTVASIGSGTGAISWPVEQVPAHVDATQARDVPTVLVTGSNGKTTTTRLVAAMWHAANVPVGWCCSDGVYVRSHTDVAVLDEGDLTGPGGARLVLRDGRVHAAVLETARGGLLRRGLAVSQAHVAVITNISADHFGEYGVSSLEGLTEAKAIVSRALIPTRGVLVLNAADAHLRGMKSSLVSSAVRRVWFSVESGVESGGVESDGLESEGAADAAAYVHEGVRQYGLGALVESGVLRVALHGVWHNCGAVRDFPITFGATAAHNIANVAAAALAAVAAGVPMASVIQALHTFGASSSDNPGRLMVRSIGGISIVMDYAHNPDGMRALCLTAAAIPAQRRLLLLGQAGNRDDTQLHALATAAWNAMPFDQVIIKDMPDMLRGRATGEVPAVLRGGLLEAGAPPARLQLAPTEMQGVRLALQWAEPGDVLVLGIHADRTRVLQLMDTLEQSGWQAGQLLSVAATDG